MTKTFLFASMLLALSACTDEVEPDVSPIAVCHGVDPTRISVNGNDINGIELNALTGNGTTLAGVSIDGRRIVVGSSLRGVRADGTSIDLLVASERDGLFELTSE